MLAHLRRLINANRYAEATKNMEDTAVRTIDRLLLTIIREESQQDSQQVPQETPPRCSPEESSASRA
eukprot:869176-Heterocapsa_arctica.AAC.1